MSRLAVDNGDGTMTEVDWFVHSGRVYVTVDGGGIAAVGSDGVRLRSGHWTLDALRALVTICESGPIADRIGPTLTLVDGGAG